MGEVKLDEISRIQQQVWILIWSRVDFINANLLIYYSTQYFVKFEVRILLGLHNILDTQTVVSKLVKLKC